MGRLSISKPPRTLRDPSKMRPAPPNPRETPRVKPWPHALSIRSVPNNIQPLRQTRCCLAFRVLVLARSSMTASCPPSVHCPPTPLHGFSDATPNTKSPGATPSGVVGASWVPHLAECESCWMDSIHMACVYREDGHALVRRFPRLKPHEATHYLFYVTHII